MRRPALICGLVLLCLIWAGPLLSTWRESFAAHMLAHMGVVALAAPFIAIGFSAERKDWRIPIWLPLVASVVELAVVWGWHTPVMRSFAQMSVFATAAEQVMFLGAGLLLWTVCLVSPGGDGRLAAAGAFGLLFTSIHMTLLGALLALSPRPLFGSGEVTCFGVVLDAGQDQALGGVLMLLIGAVVYVAGGLYLLARLLGDIPDANAERS